MPKTDKPKREALNCLVAPATRAGLVARREATGKSAGEIIDEWYQLSLGGNDKYTPEIEEKIKANLRPRKPPRAAKEIEARAAADITAQAVGRDNIDYSDVESTPTTHVTQVAQQPARPAANVQDWRFRRAARGPLEKPGGKKS